VNCVGMGHSAIELRPITSLLSPRECARQAVLFLESGRALRELSLGSKKSPSFLKGRGLSLTTVRYLKSPVSPSLQPCNAAFGSATFGPPVLPYRSKFSDCPAGAVANSYPTLDLLWDNVIAGPWGWPRSTVLAQVPARHPGGGSGRLQNARADDSRQRTLYVG
jgi:hypothetical protein